MKRIRYFFLFALLSICSLAAQEVTNETNIQTSENTTANNIRIAITNFSGSTESGIVTVSSPLNGTISTNGTSSNSLIGTPSVTIGSNLVMLAFTYRGPSCQLEITNSYNYSTTISVSNGTTYSNPMPLNPNGNTTISLTMR